MNNLVKIGNSDLSIKEFNGQRVVTFKDVDSVHERPDGTEGRDSMTTEVGLLRVKISIKFARPKFGRTKSWRFRRWQERM